MQKIPQTSTPLRLLLLEANPADAESILHELTNEGFHLDCTIVDSPSHYQEALETRPQLVIADYTLASSPERFALNGIINARLSVPLIYVSSQPGEEHAVTAIKQGADHYVMKSRLKGFGTIVRNTLQSFTIRPHTQEQFAPTSRSRHDLVHRMETQVAILNSLPTNIALIDETGVIQFVNRAWNEFALSNGIADPTKLLGENYLSYCEQPGLDLCEEPNSIADGIRQVLSGQRLDFELEYPCHTLEEKRWFQLLVTPLKSDQIIGAVVMHINVTDRRMAEENLLQLNKELEAKVEERTVEVRRQATALENCVQGVIVLEDNKIIYCNGSQERLFKLPKEQLFKTPFLQLFNEAERDRIVQALNHTKTHTYWMGEAIVERQSGEGFISEVNIVHLAGDGYLVMFMDISDKKSVLLRLEESRRFLKTVLDSFPLWVFWKNRQSVYMGCNKRFADFLGISPEEVVGKSDYDMVRGSKYAEQYQKEDREILESGIPKLGYIRQYPKENGEFGWEEVSKFPLLDGKGSVIGIVGAFHDITERKTIEDELRRKTEELDLFFSTSLDLLCIASTDGKFLRLNPMWENTTGYSMVELVGTDYLDYIHPDDLEKTIQAKEFIRDEVRLSAFENRYRHKDGYYRWLSWRTTTHGNKVYATARDMTEHYNVQAQILEREKRYRALLEGSADAIIICDLNGHIHEANQSAIVMLGYDMEQLKTLLIHDLFPATTNDQIIAQNANITQLKSFRLTDVEILHKDSSTIPVDITSSYIEVGGSHLIQKIIRDIRERKNKDEALRNLSSRLELSLNAGNIGCWSYDSFTDKLLWDDRMFTLFGVQKENFHGRYEDFNKLVHPDDVADVTNKFLECVKKNQDFASIFRIVLPDGKIRFIEARSKNTRLFQNSHFSHVGINFDVSERMEYESRLVETNRELERATHLKDEFLANMSHELRTPLNAIIGFTELLEQGVYGELSPRQLSTLQHVTDSANHLLELINDILDLAKIEAGKLTLEISDVDVDSLLFEAATISESLALPKKIRINWHKDPALQTIQGDSVRLLQILLNLLSNAIKFTPAGGKINCSVSQQNDSIHLTVSDTGTGIPEQKIPLLFKPFVQLDGSLTRQTSGTGLGLAIVKRLTELHGGTVSLQSEEGKGSRFDISIPLRQTLSNTPLPQSKNFPTNEHKTKNKRTLKRILIADDNEMNMLFMIDFLTSISYECICAKNGKDAVELATNEIPDLILMDVQMPVMDGLEAIKRIRQIPHCSLIPIISITSFAMPDDRERCISVGANEYLAKPVPLNLLKQTIEQFLSKQ